MRAYSAFQSFIRKRDKFTLALIRIIHAALIPHMRAKCGNYSFVAYMRDRYIHTQASEAQVFMQKFDALINWIRELCSAHFWQYMRSCYVKLLFSCGQSWAIVMELVEFRVNCVMKCLTNDLWRNLTKMLRWIEFELFVQ